MKIHIVGAGPAGLYFALLMKKADPRHDLRIFERDGPDDTFGWGIVFSDRTLTGLAERDAPSHAAITARFALWDNVDVVHRDQRISIRGNRFAGIARVEFLRILRERCRELGVEIEYHRTIGESDVAELARADLLIGADGANSTVRRARTEPFQPSVVAGRNKYIWLGTPRRFDGLTLTFRPDAAGWFAAHSYRFDERRSTFIVECPEPVWRAAGLAQMAEAAMCAYLGRVFEPDLGGAPLLTNNFVRWLNFPLIRNQRWFDERCVLLGDALHTAHFSIGSGTKLALEDAIALFDAMRDEPRVPAALERFEATRRPVVESLQEAAQSSLEWFENFPARMHLDPLPLAYELMTRSGRIDIERLRRRDPDFAAACERWLAAHPDGAE